MRALARNSLTSRMLWKRGTDLRRCGLLARGMTQCAAQCRAHERQLLNADALININHTKLSCCSSMLLAAATLGNSCPPSRAWSSQCRQIWYRERCRDRRSLIRVRDVSCRSEEAFPPCRPPLSSATRETFR